MYAFHYLTGQVLDGEGFQSIMNAYLQILQSILARSSDLLMK